MCNRLAYRLAWVLVILWVSVLSSDRVLAQVQDSLDPEKVHIFHADKLEGKDGGPRAERRMSGDVVLYQDSSFFFCDSAVLIGDWVTARGNIMIQQGDSLRIFADSLEYDGQSRVARLFGDVVLDHKGRQLFTDTLNYDLGSRVASYETGGLLVTEETRLRSRGGFYRVREELAFFRDSVQVAGEDFDLTADSLYFAAEAQRALFAGPTVIEMDGRTIYCEGGYYDIRGSAAVFSQNARYRSADERVRADSILVWPDEKEFELVGQAYYRKGEDVAEADRIYHSDSTEVTELRGDAYFRQSGQAVRGDYIYHDGKTGAIRTSGRTVIADSTRSLSAERVDFNEKTGEGIAVGRVIFADSVERWELDCDSLVYREREGYVRAMGSRRPLMKFDVDGDTMYLSADTILSYGDTSLTDTGRLLLAYRDVRLFKSDLQGLSDSMAYSTVDSLFSFFRNPIMWADTTQFEGDTIRIFLREKRIDRMLLRRNSFIIESPDLHFFNQIKGTWVTAYFHENEISRVLVEGNAESIYYGRDDSGAYIGVNQSVSSNFWVHFHERKIDRIVFLQQPKASLIPMKSAISQPPRLEGYDWRLGLRPVGVSALREKK